MHEERSCAEELNRMAGVQARLWCLNGVWKPDKGWHQRFRRLFILGESLESMPTQMQVHRETNSREVISHYLPSNRVKEEADYEMELCDKAKNSKTELVLSCGRVYIL